MKIVLGSSSPRRKAILKGVGISKFRVEKSTFEEDIEKTGLTPEEYVMKTCEGKVNELKSRLKDFDLLMR